MKLFVFLSQFTYGALEVYYWLHILAFLISWINADPNNNFVYWIRILTVPLWNWVRRKVPEGISFFAPILAIILVVSAQKSLPGIIQTFGAVSTLGLEINTGAMNVVWYLAIGGLVFLNHLAGFFIFFSILWFIFSLVNPPQNNIFVRSVFFIIDPLITPIQRMLPRTNIDISPLIVAGLAFLFSSMITQLFAPVSAQIVTF